ncbi:hypothetical protein ASPBRDRAFT_489651 [Aspergillus brasiliensis CBS 101740]|uniref:Uncharacterized protein n=1 Tax=Aspergillus brasiliensis (strain CBS 101740 / IMI 381727 / IBT 21946) TaxID=767769 RepID=A0A1L9U1U4_ASPBC|nr:hypothetical protein ASPBRDRAFT_565455 [Aspergillus brasiliensis CBS 101740]OJJ65660.1 hypothetical protein ASPBRDRAFT_489651 [Aspergillus brasiliensis CBS 101740]
MAFHKMVCSGDAPYEGTHSPWVQEPFLYIWLVASSLAISCHAILHYHCMRGRMEVPLISLLLHAHVDWTRRRMPDSGLNTVGFMKHIVEQFKFKHGL